MATCMYVCMYVRIYLVKKSILSRIAFQLEQPTRINSLYCTLRTYEKDGMMQIYHAKIWERLRMKLLT